MLVLTSSTAVMCTSFSLAESIVEVYGNRKRKGGNNSTAIKLCPIVHRETLMCACTKTPGHVHA